MRVARLIGKRLLMLPVSLFVLITLAFGLIELMPGNPAVTLAGSFATADAVARIEQELGLDRPLHERYLRDLRQYATGDLGRSYFSQRPVRAELARRLPATVELVAVSLLLAGIIGLALGGVGAYFRRRWVDTASRSSITVIQSTPEFLLALLLIYFLFFLAGIAPAPVGRLGFGGGTSEGRTGLLLIDSLLRGDFDLFVRAARQLMLPVLALGIVYSAYFGKTARSTMVAALSSSQVEFARACGLPEWKVLYYAFLQARTPILTYGAILFGALVGGAAIVETIFSWQGAGQWALEAILRLDVPAIQGFIIAAGFITILIYLMLDVIVMILDPRVRYE